MGGRGLLWLCLWLLHPAVVPPAVATPTLTITPDTLDAGARPSAWNVTLADITTDANPSWIFNTTLPVFAANSTSTSTVSIAGCAANYSSSTAQSLTLDLPTPCTLSGTFSFTIPATYLAANPLGSTTVSLSGLNRPLSTTIDYTVFPQVTVNADPVIMSNASSVHIVVTIDLILSFELTIEAGNTLDGTRIEMTVTAPFFRRIGWGS
eukprot:EG_transcript_31621